MSVPLAERIRPKNLDDYLSQQHLLGEQGALRTQLKSGVLPSMILWGPPGTGKTTLATIIATQSGRPFHQLSAVDSGVAAVREVIEKAKKADTLFSTKNPILFIDEIHRFSKSQQDSLLGAVEKGWVTLIGATTENPSFEVIPALLSRSQVYILKSFSKKDLEDLLHRAISVDAILSAIDIELKETEALIQLSGGDARKLLNTLELVVLSEVSEDKKSAKVIITNDLVSQKVQKNTVRYDKTGDQHYDIISAFIKSIRGSDPNAAVYWLARMIEGGEDVKFIARRLLILASEDIGMANPNALLLATSTFQAVAAIGYPEARIILSQCTIYLATSPKSNASYAAIGKAQQLVRQTGDLSIPLSIRNAPTKLMKELGYGQNYQYAHNYEGNFTPHEFMPEEIIGTSLYEPGKNAKESNLKMYLTSLWGNKYKF
ncbi:replication-associated recombination protein A [Patiriisocius marinus]|uniref:Replication-associated recombination protein A n=1 Tax=Patiriisocius marinus TaxID=1397112 RepID=A0A5J4J4C8_9FLAO|nr:replication-associated recombination protein A [Patiriisocius marinus]GER60740.1 ATPase AAA [Patiriisocius marinus]